MAVDQIGTKALVDCSVAAADIADGTITSAKLAGSIANAKLSNSSITVNGTSIALGASGAVPPVQWQSVVVSDGSTVTTMVAGRGYFVNNTSAAGLVKLPLSASAGDIVSIKDYAGNFGTNNLTIQRNGHNIQGNTNDSTISTNRASLSLVYVDATKGWLYTNESNVAQLGPTFISATGGTVTTTGNFKIHSFTGDGNFVVASVGNPLGSTTVDYVVVAGGGGGGGTPCTGNQRSGGAGAGGYRESSGAASGCYSASPLGSSVSALPVSAQTYPVTVGSGGSGTYGSNANGSNSVFSTITSAGGGKGASEGTPGGPAFTAGNGGSGGGGASNNTSAGSGNTPPVSPSQGNNGGTSGGYHSHGGGGGGAGEVGNTDTNGYGGDGVASSITSSPVTRAGGGSGHAPACGGGDGGGGPFVPGSGNAVSGTANTGGGGGAGYASPNGPGGNGGSGIVIVRYKYQ